MASSLDSIYESIKFLVKYFFLYCAKDIIAST